MNKELGSPGPELTQKRTAEIAPKVDIGPKSLLWSYLGDQRMILTGMSAGILQLMHPEIGAGVSQHSTFFEDPWGRISRSIPEIIGVVYDRDGEKTGKKIKDYHTPIKGQDEKGRRYHALKPETYWWAHSTFHMMVENIPERFGQDKLALSDKRQLYQESKAWYSRYGVSDTPAPVDYEGFREKWNDTCKNTLELTPAATQVIDKITTREVNRRPEVPQWMWGLGLRLPANELLRVLAIGGLPATVRERFDIPWSKVDKVKLKTIETGVKQLWPLLPEKYRYHPRARVGMEKAKNGNSIVRVTYL